VIREPFKKLSDNALKFMTPQRLWTYPKADVYLFYSLSQSPPYNCSAPFWRNAREEIFHELRSVAGHPTIYYLALVKHNERSMHLPTGQKDVSDHLYFPMTEGGSIIATPNTEENSYLSACKDIGIHSPHLVPNWDERGGKMWKRLHQYQHITRNENELVVILPEPDTMYFHAVYRDD
jgi:hypothetical protein